MTKPKEKNSRAKWDALHDHNNPLPKRAKVSLFSAVRDILGWPVNQTNRRINHILEGVVKPGTVDEYVGTRNVKARKEERKNLRRHSQTE